MWGGGTAVFDPEKFSDYSTKNFSKLHVSEEGGVVDMRPTVGFFEQIRKDLANPELFPEAQVCVSMDYAYRAFVFIAHICPRCQSRVSVAIGIYCRMCGKTGGQAASRIDQGCLRRRD